MALQQSDTLRSKSKWEQSWIVSHTTGSTSVGGDRGFAMALHFPLVVSCSITPSLDVTCLYRVNSLSEGTVLKMLDPVWAQILELKPEASYWLAKPKLTTFGTLALRKGSDDVLLLQVSRDSWDPIPPAPPTAWLVCQMLQMAQTWGWEAKAGHGEGVVWKECRAKREETECRRKGTGGEAGNRSNAGFQKQTLWTGLVISPLLVLTLNKKGSQIKPVWSIVKINNTAASLCD